MSLLINKFYSLPKELVNIILAYSDVIIYRHGKYMNRLLKTDVRLNLYNTVPKPRIYTVPNLYVITEIYFHYNNPSNANIGFARRYLYHISTKRLTVITQINTKISHRMITYYTIDYNNKWRKTVNYTM